MSKRVYNRIKVVLAEKGRTNIWLAETLGMNKSTVSKWCTNDIQPSMETLFEIARVLEVDAKELLVAVKN
jgi:DNA-binding XRE family transcriptional regulator